MVIVVRTHFSLFLLTAYSHYNFKCVQAPAETMPADLGLDDTVKVAA